MGIRRSLNFHTTLRPTIIRGLCCRRVWDIPGAIRPSDCDPDLRAVLGVQLSDQGRHRLGFEDGVDFGALLQKFYG